MRENEFGQLIGDVVRDKQYFSRPKVERILGQYVVLEKLSQCHSEDLYQHLANEKNDDTWTYLFASPIHDKNDFMNYLSSLMTNSEAYYFAVIDVNTDKAMGYLSLMRVNTTHGTIEVGNVHFSKSMQHTRMSTEAHYLLMTYVFEILQYRRYEWKCDNLNEPSKKAATRLGFSYEGLFKKAIIYKNRNRDTAWYAMIDDEWPEMKYRFERWLSRDNFDSAGKQQNKL